MNSNVYRLFLKSSFLFSSLIQNLYNISAYKLISIGSFFLFKILNKQKSDYLGSIYRFS